MLPKCNYFNFLDLVCFRKLLTSTLLPIAIEFHLIVYWMLSCTNLNFLSDAVLHKIIILSDAVLHKFKV